MIENKIKKFYSKLKFPGLYSRKDFKFYEKHGITNVYLKEIDQYLIDGMTMLDIGCGSGFISNLFAINKPNCKITALDFSDSIDYGISFAKQNHITNITWIKKDFLKFNSKKQYDTIICCGVLHHIPEYLSALDKMKKLLKPNGKLLLAVYNTNGKILKQIFNLKYHNNILYTDQELNPFELSFSNKQVCNMCNDLEFHSASPSISNRFIDFLALFNSENGGLVLYVFNKQKIST